MASLFDDLPSRENLLRQEIEALKQQNAYLSALHETSLGLIDRLDRKELLESILHRACLMSGTEHGYIYLPGPRKDEMQMRVGMGFFRDQLGLRVQPGEGVGGNVWQSGQPLQVENYRTWVGRLSDKSLDRLGTVAGIPLIYRERIEGVIGLAHVEPGKRFGADDIDILKRFAELAMVALDKAKLYGDVRHELSERKRTEEILQLFGNTIGACDRLGDFLSQDDPVPISQPVSSTFDCSFGHSQSSGHFALGGRVRREPPE